MSVVTVEFILESVTPVETTVPLAADETAAEMATLHALGAATPEGGVDALALEATEGHSAITGAPCGEETTELEPSKAVRVGLATEVAGVSDTETAG